MANNGQTESNDADVKQGLLAAYRRFMGPLVRILIRNGISFDEFADELKGVFVEIANDDFPIDEKSPSGTRIAILTGLTRKEVKRQFELQEGKSSKGENKANRVNRVLDGWHTSPEFTGPYNMPLELFFDRKQGNVPSFSDLVKQFSGDMSPRAMFDELERLKVIEVLPDESIRAVTKAYISAELDPEVLKRMGSIIGNLAETIDYNFHTKDPGKRKRFERNAFTDRGIPEDALDDFSDLVRIKGVELLETLDHFLNAHEAKEDNGKKATIKTGVEIYHYIE